MPLWHPKRPRDLNQWAKQMVDIATGEVDDLPKKPDESGSLSVSDFARAGGLKGGRARADKLSPEARSDIARKAAAKMAQR